MSKLREYRFRKLTTLERLKLNAAEGAAMLVKYTGEPPRKLQRMLVPPEVANYLDDTDDGTLEAAWGRLKAAGVKVQKRA